MGLHNRLTDSRSVDGFTRFDLKQPNSPIEGYPSQKVEVSQFHRLNSFTTSNTMILENFNLIDAKLVDIFKFKLIKFRYLC